MNKTQFKKIAGGVYKSKKSYEHWDGVEKKENFWDFFKGRIRTKDGFVEYDKEIVSIYGGVPVETLIERQVHSIEHIIPKEFLRKYLKRRYYTIRRGATVNPFNFAPSHRLLNTARSNFPYDLEEDRVVANYKINLEPNYTDYGLDYELEWVIPTKTKGDVARAILYMCLIYDIDDLYQNHINDLVRWAKFDKPTFWEIKYNQWVHRFKGISNPFIQYANSDPSKPYSELLDDDELLNELRGENVIVVNPSEIKAPKERKKVPEGAASIIAALINPSGKDFGNETITLMNTSDENIFLLNWKLENEKKQSYFFGEEYLDAGTFKIIKLPKNSIRLSNKGGTIMLKDYDGRVVDEVSYTSTQGRKAGWQTIFR